MGIELYAFAASVPSRMVRLLAEHLDLKVDFKNVDITKGDQFDPDYVKINPQHTIPTLIDNGLIVTESRAILMYLANKYSGDATLYPSEPDKRALVDMRLCFDLATLYSRFTDAYFPVVFQKVPLDASKVEKFTTALGYVEAFLAEGNGFIAGSELTIADFSMGAILSTAEAFGHDMSEFSAINAYLTKCAEVMKGWEELNQSGATMFGEWFKAALAEVSG